MLEHCGITYIFMGDRIWQGRTNFGCQNWSGGTVFGGGPIFSLQASVPVRSVQHEEVVAELRKGVTYRMHHW